MVPSWESYAPQAIRLRTSTKDYFLRSLCPASPPTEIHCSPFDREKPYKLSRPFAAPPHCRATAPFLLPKGKATPGLVGFLRKGGSGSTWTATISHALLKAPSPGRRKELFIFAGVGGAVYGCRLREKIGRSKAIPMPPTTTPIRLIISGSIMLVAVLMAISTSWS